MSERFEADSNFVVETKLEVKNIRFYDVKNEPFQVFGVYFNNGKFRRIPEDLAKAISPEMHWLHANTTGGRVRFATNSTFVAINAKMPQVGKWSHFAMTGSSGFDLFVDGKSKGSLRPPLTMNDGYESILYFDNPEMREITINFPLYSEVSELYIGLQENAIVQKAKPYKNDKPIVYYGSSITQGASASRPGNSYQSIISRRLNVDFVNLGFSGNAKAEPEMVEYIKNLDMSVFVYDYDHNAPTTEHLRNTHEKMFLAIREVHPDLPVVMMSRPKFTLNEEEIERLEIIKTTYENAKSRGDTNVYFIDGKTLMSFAKDDGTVDDCHPNDWGFASMAIAVGDVLEKII